MVPTGVALKELVVKPKKEKYSKKNNPAVEFVKRLMAKKQDFEPKNHDYYNYNKYEKMTMGLNDFSEKQKKNWFLGKFKFIFDYLDTSEVSGKPILTVSVKEKVSDYHYRRSPESEKEIVRGTKRAGIDEAFDQESVQRFLEDVFREVNIFSNDIPMMQNRFVSPLSAFLCGGFKMLYLAFQLFILSKLIRFFTVKVFFPHGIVAVNYFCIGSV